MSSALTKNIHPDLLLSKELMYDQCNFGFDHLRIEEESSEYGACTFVLNKLEIVFRVAKITPTKTGQFVTIWKRNANGPIEPFAVSDNIDFIIVSTRSGNRFGQFIFPKSALLHKGIISGNNKEGKRGIRVYPPWDKTTSQQAGKTQKWQTAYFIEIPTDQPIDITLAKKLLVSK